MVPGTAPRYQVPRLRSPHPAHMLGWTLGATAGWLAGGQCGEHSPTGGPGAAGCHDPGVRPRDAPSSLEASPAASPAAAIRVNGAEAAVEPADPRSLLRYLRDDLRLTGAKPGCGEGVCGACTVLLDGLPVRACVTPLGAALGHEVTTVESLAGDVGLHPLQQAFVE